jgi:hypothetical protein
MMHGRESMIDGQYEIRLQPDDVLIRGKREAVERVVCEIGLHRRMCEQVQWSIDMLDEQPPDEQPRPWDGAEIATASFGACVLLGVLAAGWHILYWLWSGS